VVESEDIEVLLSCEQVFGEVFMKDEYMDRKEIFEYIENNNEEIEKMFDNCVDDSKKNGQRINCMILEYVVS